MIGLPILWLRLLLRKLKKSLVTTHPDYETLKNGVERDYTEDKTNLLIFH